MGITLQSQGKKWKQTEKSQARTCPYSKDHLFAFSVFQQTFTNWKDLSKNEYSDKSFVWHSDEYEIKLLVNEIKNMEGKNQCETLVSILFLTDTGYQKMHLHCHVCYTMEYIIVR